MAPDLAINVIVEGIGNDSLFKGLHRVLHFDPAADVAVLFGVVKPHQLPLICSLQELRDAIDKADVRLTTIRDRSIQLKAESELQDSYRSIRDEAWERIEPLVTGPDAIRIYFPEARGLLVNNRAQAMGVGKNQIYADLRRWWAYGQNKSALLPNWKDSGPRGEQPAGTAKRGKKPLGVKVGRDPEGIAVGDTRSLLMKGARLFYVGKATIPSAYKRTIDIFFNDGYELKDGVPIPILKPPHEVPTENQFRTLVNALNRAMGITRKKAGALVYALKLRALEKRARHGAFGPGARYEIDSTILDIYLVSSFNPRWIIGRPVLYVVVDVFSRMVVGFYVGLEGPSWAGARLALANAFSDKVAFCAKQGVKITANEWPCHHVAHKVLADRGEMICEASDELANSLGVVVEQAPPRRPDWKPFVERDFGIITQGTVIFLPGAVDQREKERTQRDYRLDACLTLEELTTILIMAFLEHNQTSYRPSHLPVEMIEDGFTDATPLALWRWGMVNATGYARIESPDRIQAALLNAEQGTVKSDGIHYGDERFICPTAREENWLTRARANRTWKVKLRVDASTDRVWLQHEDDGRLELCAPLDPDVRSNPRRFEEIADKIAILRLAGESKERDTRQKSAERRARVSAISDAAAARAKKARAGLTKAQVLDGIDDNRRLELAAERLERAGEEAKSHLPPPPSKQVNSPVVSSSAKTRQAKLLEVARKAWSKEST